MRGEAAAGDGAPAAAGAPGRAGRPTHLRLHVEDGHEALLVDVSDRLQLGAVHGLLVRPVLEVLVVRDVVHHLLVRHEEVVLAVLLVLLRRPRRVCRGKINERWVEVKSGQMSAKEIHSFWV